jgi:D-alanine transaminase
MTTVYLNGVWLPMLEAKVSVMDRGFLFGDGIYEVIPFYGSDALGLDLHYLRLQKSLRAIDIKNPFDFKTFYQLCQDARKTNEAENAFVYLQITRGVQIPRKHIYPADLTPTVFVYANAFKRNKYLDGVKAILLPDIRWKKCAIKSLNLLPNILMSKEADEKTAEEALLYDGEFLTEGASSNFFMVKNDEVFTTPLSDNILDGITQRIVKELLVKERIPLQEKKISLSELKAADEIWLTSSTRELIPVIQLEDAPVGTGKPSLLFERIRKTYDDEIIARANPPALMTFPTDYSLKIIVKTESDAEKKLTALIKTCYPQFSETQLQKKLSGQEKYTSYTLTVTVNSRAEIDFIYRTITASDLVVMAL